METLGSRLGFLSISDGFPDNMLSVFDELWNSICVFCQACSQVTFFMISGSESGCPGLQNQAFGVKSFAKTFVSNILGFCSFVYHFLMFFEGIHFDDFWCFGDKLEFDDLRWLSRGGRS